MAYIWKKEYETNNISVDRQHKQLVDIFNKFMEDCMSGKSFAKLDEMLKFLCEYTVKHFSDEENWQKQINYPGYMNHKKIHDAFKQTALNLYDKFKKEGSSASMIVQLNKDIGEWLVNHILFEDQKIAAYLRA